MEDRIALTGASGFIGTHLVNILADAGSQVLNLDVKPPKLNAHRPYWSKVDVTNSADVIASLSAFKPTQVIHLAARTDTLSDDVDKYRVNWIGAENLSEACVELSVPRFVHVSTQYVHAVELEPRSDVEFSPFTAYGESKVKSEKLVRDVLDGSSVTWTIVRPTNIWGAYHPRYADEFWKVLSRGQYLHPALAKSPIRAYGYVENVAWQLRGLLELDDPRVHEHVFYVGDRPLRLDDWVDTFSRLLRGAPARRVPLSVLKAIAAVGDSAKLLGLPAPLTRSRLRNMVESSAAPMGPIHDLLGDPPFSLNDGVCRTGTWLLELGFELHNGSLTTRRAGQM